MTARGGGEGDRDGSGTGSSRRVVRFAVVDLPEQLEAFATRWPDARADALGLAFALPDRSAVLRVPLAAPRVAPRERIADYFARFAPAAELQLVLLLQAGAVAFGLWHGSELLHHKALRRYVVRGHGRAQPLHRRTRGKSRYGSRLRLQNWKRLLAETNARLAAEVAAHGEPERVFWSAPVRALHDLFAAEPPPPFVRGDAALQRVPMHVHVPDHAELLRVHAWLQRGRLELP